MVIATHRSDRSKAAVEFPRSLFRLSALFAALISLVVPATALGDIYKWVDEQGRISYSDVPPPTSGKAMNVEVVRKDPKLTPSEQALLARIQSLERQVEAQRYVAQAPAVPPPTPYPSYYPPAPPPPSPPPNYYDSGYYGSYPSYPTYYPAYSYPVVASYVAYPARAFINRPGFAPSHGGFSHGRGGHGGGHGGRR